MNKNTIMVRTFAVALFTMLVASPAISAEKPVVRDAPAPKTMLFIGNSFFYYNNSLHNHTRRLVQSLNKEHAKSYFFKSLTLSASYLSDHAAFDRHMIQNYKHKRKHGPWDVVLLQGHSREPISKKKAKGFQEAARKLVKMIRDAGSRPAFFMTWAYKDKPEMTAKLRDAYTAIGNELHALVVPVGLAFAQARKDGMTDVLYAKDKHHPSLFGTYLAACTLYATLYGKSPEGATYTAGLSEKLAKSAQTIAWKATKAYFGK